MTDEEYELETEMIDRVLATETSAGLRSLDGSVFFKHFQSSERRPDSDILQSTEREMAVKQASGTEGKWKGKAVADTEATSAFEWEWDSDLTQPETELSDFAFEAGDGNGDVNSGLSDLESDRAAPGNEADAAISCDWDSELFELESLPPTPPPRFSSPELKTFVTSEG